MDIKSCFKIGYIAKVHGLQGEVTAIINESIDFDSVKALFLEIKGSLVPYFIENVSDRTDKVFLKFEDVDRSEDASLLKGCSIYIPKDSRPKLKRGDFYDDEVIGFTVENEGQILGPITEIMRSGITTFYKVTHNGKEVLLPKNAPFIKKVIKSSKKMVIELPDGYLDI